MQDDEDRITLVGVEVENFRRLSCAKVEFVPEKGLVAVTGPTAAGKTSLLKAIAGALGGAGEVHEDSIKEGAEKDRVTLKLSNGYTVERRGTEANPKGYLDVIGPDGGKHGQTKLDGWLGPRSFDPLAFFSLDPGRQRDVLFSIGTDPDLPEKLESVRSEYQEVYDRRTPVISERRELQKIEQPEGERPDPIDTSEEMKRLRDLQAEERARGDARREAEKARDEAKDAIARVEEQSEEVERLEAKLAAAKEALESERENAVQAKAEFDEKKKAWKGLPDPSDEMEEVQARLEKASEVEDEIAPWKRWEDAQSRLDDLKDREQALTDELGSLKTRETQLLDQAGIPVDGLSFNEDGEPLLNGRPLALASGRERIEVAVNVAIAADPRLRICLLDEANDLDLEALERLDELADEHDFQIWAVRIGLEGPGEVVVDDGEAWDRDREVTAAVTEDVTVEGSGEDEEEVGVELPDWDKDPNASPEPVSEEEPEPEYELEL